MRVLTNQEKTNHLKPTRKFGMMLHSDSSGGIFTNFPMFLVCVTGQKCRLEGTKKCLGVTDLITPDLKELNVE